MIIEDLEAMGISPKKGDEWYISFSPSRTLHTVTVEVYEGNGGPRARITLTHAQCLTLAADICANAAKAMSQ